MHCPLSKAGLSDPASHAISVTATLAALRLLVMSFITFVNACTSGPSELSDLTSFTMLRALRVDSGCTKTKWLSAIASQPICIQTSTHTCPHRLGWLNGCSEIFLRLPACEGRSHGLQDVLG